MNNGYPTGWKHPKPISEQEMWLKIKLCLTEKAYAGSKLWRARKKFVLKRDNFQCVNCGSTENLELDHIKYNDDFGFDQPSDLQILCYFCHFEKHHPKLQKKGIGFVRSMKNSSNSKL